MDDAHTAPGRQNLAAVTTWCRTARSKVAAPLACETAVGPCPCASAQGDVALPDASAPLIKVAAAIVIRSGNVLAARRKPGKDLAGFWELPGGKVEINERPQQCLKRELFEEFDVEAIVGDFFAESIYRYETKSIHLLTYFTQVTSEIETMREHDKICWLTGKNLHSVTWASADLPVIRNLGQELLTT